MKNFNGNNRSGPNFNNQYGLPNGQNQQPNGGNNPNGQNPQSNGGYPPNGYNPNNQGQGFGQQMNFNPQNQNYPNPQSQSGQQDQQDQNIPNNQIPFGQPNYNNVNQQNPYNPNQFQQDIYLQNSLNQQSYNLIEQESMHDYYEYKQGKTKLIVLIVSLAVAFIFILGIFTSPFINGNPMVLNEESRSVLSYSENVHAKTISFFTKDKEYYTLANEIAIKAYKPDINLDNELSGDIGRMNKVLDEFKKLDKSHNTPVGFDGDKGLHQQIIAILELRVQNLNDLRLIAQGQTGKIKEFNQNFGNYIGLRDQVINLFNAKYEANYYNTLFDVKELEFNESIQEKKQK